MTVPVALLAAISVIIAAALALIGVLLGHQAARIGALEGRVDAADVYMNRLWVWARHLLDMYFRHRQPGAPDPPPIPLRD